MSLLPSIFGKKLDVHEQKVVYDVRDYGCHITQVSEDDEGPGFSYSIGFPVTVRQPEVIVFGLRNDVMKSITNKILRQCEAGLMLGEGVPVSDLIEGFYCILRHVTDAEAIKEHFGWAAWYHRSQNHRELVEAYQIVWPGAVDGLYPWDEGCSQIVINSQPALYKKSVH